MGWLNWLEWVVLALVLVVLVPVVWLFVRRRLLSAKGGLFDCALRLNDRVPGAGWALGLARYEGNVLEWYRAFSLLLSPTVRFDREQTSVLGRRAPDNVEALVLFSDDEVVRLQGTRGARTRVYELAMSPGSTTGLMSWFEAGPPGGSRYPGVE
jgi:hypothetical protein